MRKFLTLAVMAGFVLLAAPTLSMASYTQTKHPIVLVHGVTGFNTIGGLINYFHTVPWNLERSGARVYSASVSFVNSSEQRGQQLANYINGLGVSKVNIMAHSQGAPTSRVTASLIPHKVASITSINGVNKGSRVADVARGILPPGSYVEGGVSAIANALGDLVNALSDADNPQDGVAALETLTTRGTTQLNDALGWKGVNRDACAGTNEDVWINGNKIKFFSWTGTAVWTNWTDITDPFLGVTTLAFGNEANDGLVGECSTKMGNVIGTHYEMNHVDAINHLFGARSWRTDPISLYRSHANRLKNRGL
ncbi:MULTISPECIES: esterase/lipase family protein [Marinobacter]|uniref:esterase/lipase family protein n=1 Tax=Marinobacter TaxID=2742 RepID=UPI002003C460|nr:MULTISPECIES: alpha/beta fold hydrolase [Marinobacter]MCK7550408.1 alpha/beta fold hydrolase [Marinobacter goseongensis]MDV3502389.1 alpha/beta fold hydrolase [Marinobacter sp. M-5]